MTDNRYKKLALGVVFDAIGMVPFLDLLWAPLSAYLMTKMYPGKKGKIAAAISFVEEALPFLDFVPTFTIMWVYTYVFKGKKEDEPTKTIEV